MSIFVLKDSEGNYVHSESICYSKSLKKVVFSYSLTLTNGFYSDQNKIPALIKLGKLQVANEKYNLGKSFSVVEIDRYDTLIAEHKLYDIKVGFDPIKHEYIDVDVVIPPCTLRPVKRSRCNIGVKDCPCRYRQIA